MLKNKMPLHGNIRAKAFFVFFKLFCKKPLTKAMK